MGLSDTSQLFTHVSDSVDGSSSSCPPSTVTSEDSTQEGYLILTFDKAKRARLKTAVFADVSDCRFEDDFDEEDENDLYNWPSNETEPDNSTRTPCPVVAKTPENVGYSKKDCYGEAVWVGTGEAAENKASATPSPPSAVSENHHGLIRTIPITNRIPDAQSTTNVLPASPRKSLINSNPVDLEASDSFNMSQAVPLRESQQKHLNVSFRWTNRTGPKAGFPHSRQNGFFRGGFSSVSPYSNVSESGTEKYHRKMLRCEACGKYYRNEYSLHHHICLKRKDVWKKGDIPSDVVDGQLVYFCPTCHKPFKWLGNLTRHFYVHTGQRFFKCDICSKEFFSAYQVKRHMNSHTGRRFKCEVCEKPFTCKYACAWHTRQHYTYSE